MTWVVSAKCDRRSVASSFGDSVATREDLTHAKVGGQPSHDFKVHPLFFAGTRSPTALMGALRPLPRRTLEFRVRSAHVAE
jgi:hypothetical protein